MVSGQLDWFSAGDIVLALNLMSSVWWVEEEFCLTGPADFSWQWDELEHIETVQKVAEGTEALISQSLTSRRLSYLWFTAVKNINIKRDIHLILLVYC